MWRVVNHKIESFQMLFQDDPFYFQAYYILASRALQNIDVGLELNIDCSTSYRFSTNEIKLHITFFCRLPNL